MQTRALSYLIELKCRNCGSPLTQGDVSPEAPVVRCPHCRALFALPERSGREPIPRPQAETRESFRIGQRGDTLEITERWFGAGSFFLLFFTLFWNAGVLIWNGAAWFSGFWLLGIFGLVHTAIGLFLIYSTAASFLNSTVIRASRSSVTVKTGPLPWKGDKQIDGHEVLQLFCSEKITRTKRGMKIRYDVQAVLPENRRQILVTVPQLDDALFIEQQLERHLGIADVPVEGESRR